MSSKVRGHCVQCLKGPRSLSGGRCSTCRERMSVKEWEFIRDQEQRQLAAMRHASDPLGVQLNAFEGGKPQPQVVTRLLSIPQCDALLAALRAEMDAMHGRKVERLANGAIKSTHFDMATGQKITCTIERGEVA